MKLWMGQDKAKDIDRTGMEQADRDSDALLMLKCAWLSVNTPYDSTEGQLRVKSNTSLLGLLASGDRFWV